MPATSTRLPARRLRIRRAQVERIPAREQAVDLESPRQLEHVFQRARLRLRDVDRLLLLIDARLHAVVADAVAGRGRHRIVDDDHGERADREPFRLDLVELGNLFFERAAGERHAERAFLERRARRGRVAPFSLQPLRARVLALLVAPDAVVRLIERAGEVGAGIGQLEAFAAAQVLRVSAECGVARGCRRRPAARGA